LSGRDDHLIALGASEHAHADGIEGGIRPKEAAPLKGPLCDLNELPGATKRGRRGISN
jgi:hypothetical protein